MIPSVLVIGEPGSGKSEASASDAVYFPGAAFVGDAHKDSLAQRVLLHAEGDILFDRISDLDHNLGYGLLNPSTHPDPRKRAQENQRKVRLFVEVLMRRRGGDIAAAPLMEEWITALLHLYFAQAGRPPVQVLPFGFLPGTDEFKALLRGCTMPEVRAKFEQLESLAPRALRSEAGSAMRLVNAVFRAPEFVLRCRSSFDLGAFLQNGGKLILERGDADEDVTRTIIGGINMLVTDHCERRPQPYPPVRVYLDECTNARTAGAFEEKKAGETRKYGQSWFFLCQHPNFPNGPEGYFQNCQEKHFFRTGDHALARKLAGFVVGGLPRGEESRASMIDAVASQLMNFKPGWRYVVGPGGTRKDYVKMLKGDWPAWPGIEEDLIRDKLCQIYARPEYGGRDEPPDTTSSGGTPSPPPSSPPPSSAAERWRRGGRRPAGGS